METGATIRYRGEVVYIYAFDVAYDTARQPIRESRERELAATQRPPMRVVRNATTGEVDYLGIPGQPMRPAPDHAAAQPETSGDYLDIPAFLRRQAD